MQALHLRDARFRYEGSTGWALDGVSLDVEKGEFVTILGANGSGKSTICLMSNGLVPHALPGDLEGTAEVFGLDVRNHPVAELATKVGIIFQEPESQLVCMRVEEEVAVGPENQAVRSDEIREWVEWALVLVGMEGYNDRSPFSLSGGQKQRVAIAAALSMRPDMLVLDEPAYALDPVGRVELYRVLKELKEHHGMTVLLAECDSEEAAKYSDKVALMKDGRVISYGKPRDVLGNPERLRALGVTPPQVSEVSALLKERLEGADFSFISVDEAERAINEKFTNRKRGREQ